MVYLITYDLNKGGDNESNGQDYETLYNAIKELGEHNHSMKSVWFVE